MSVRPTVVKLLSWTKVVLNMFLARQGKAKTRVSSLTTALLCAVLTACGGGGGSSSTSTPAPVTPTTPSEPTTPTVPTVNIVPFNFQQRAENQAFKSNAVQSASFVNATGGFRLPIADQSLQGNLTLSIDLEDPDGITSAYVGFNGSATAIELCNQNCGDGLVYHRTVTGVNPLDHGMSSGTLQLNLMVGDTAGNLTTVNTVSFFWQQTLIAGFAVNRAAGSVNLDWNGLSNYLRYNVYVASVDGVTHENYQQLPDGQAYLAIRDPQLLLTDKEDAKTFYATVTGVNGSGESAFGEKAKIAALAGSIDNPPTAVNDDFIMDEDTLLNQNLITNDFDAESQVLRVSTAPLRAPENGTLTINEDGSFEYKPQANFSGRDNFRYQITDGLQQSDEADVIITVQQGNDAPEPSYNNYNLVALGAKGNNTSSRAPLTIDAPGLLINDLDIDSGNLSIITEPLNPPTQGTIQLNADGSFLYDSNAGATGEDQFTYQTTDGAGGTAQATVRITINGDSFFPRAATDKYTLTEGETFVADNTSASTASILANDTDLDAGDSFTITTPLVREPAHGTLNLAADGTFTYTPNPGFYGTDSFIYEITDQQTHTGQAGVVFTINRRNDPPIAANDVYVIEEDVALNQVANGGILTNDTDVDFDPINLLTTPLQAPSNGQLALSSDGSFGYVPNPNFFGSDSFTYQIDDGTGLTATGTVTFTITNVNDIPVANDDTIQIGINEVAPINVLVNDTDVENQTLSIVSAAANTGTVAINADSTLTYTPPAGFEGSAEIDYAIDDGGGVTAAAKVFVTVTNTNQLPAAADDSYTIAEDNTLSSLGGAATLLTANDSDPEGATLTVNSTPVINTTNGFLTLFTDGNFSYQPNGNFFGSDSFTYEVNDGNGGTATAVVAINITSVNDAPNANNDTVLTSEDTLNNINVLINDSDIENDPISITQATASNGTTAVLGDNTINYTPNLNFIGSDVINYTISDGNGGVASAQVLLTVQNINDPPSANNDSAQTTEGIAVTVNVLSNDSDIDGDTLTVIAANASSGSIGINGDNSLTYTPNTGFNGTDIIDYTISDGNNATASASVTISVAAVNDNPTAVNDSVTINEDNNTNINVLANDSDIDGDPLSLSNVTADIGTTSINADNTVSFQPPLNFNGLATLSYTVIDGQGGSAQAQALVTVTAINDNPVAAPDTAVTNEDTLVIINVLANDSDVDNTLNSLTVSSVTANNGGVSVSADQSVNYQPNPNFNGIDTISYTVSDGSGGSAASTVSVTVAPLNDPPVAANDSQTTLEDTAVTINVLSNDTDPDGDNLTITLAVASSGTTTINAGSTITYTPTANFNGTDSISYQITDPSGQTAQATVAVTITSVNDLPVAVNDTAITNEDVPVTINVLANDTDVDNPTLTITAAAANNGQVTVDGSSNLIYTPNTNFGGTDTITYSISDGSGGTASAVVNVTVSGVNDLPVATNDTATTAEDTAATIDVLANDSDIDGNTLTISTASATNGTATITGAVLTYTPNANFNGSDTLSYSISDGAGGSASATVAISVTAVNDLPIAVNDSAIVNEDTQTTINVLTNDSDIDEDTLTVTAASAFAGTVSIQTDQTLSYTPNSNFNGSDTINYTIADGNGGTASSTVSLSITATNDAPVAANDATVVNEDVTITINVLSNDTDIDGDTLSIAATSAGNGSVAINTDQSLNYTPNANFNGNDVINYTISDGNGGSDLATVNVTVNPINDNPVAVSEAISTDEDSSFTLAVLTNDSDVDGDTLSVASASATSGTTTVSTDNIISYTPNANFNGSDSISYTISDSQGGEATASVVVTVVSVNDVPVATSDTATTSEDTATTISVLSNDTDLDGDTLTVQSATATNGSVTINSGTTLTYTPTANFNGSDIINYSVSDGQGGTAAATVAIRVSSVNDVPVANADTASTNEDTLVSINVTTNDTDEDGDTLTITAVAATEGNPVINSTSNTIDFTPTNDFNGSVTITYTVSDGNGGVASSTVAVTVNPVNDDPVITADTHTMDEDVKSNIDPLANDSDVDGDTLSITGATASNGSVSIIQAVGKSAFNNVSTHTLDYLPNANYNGAETITYTISDGNGGTASSTVSVTINPINDLPVAVNDTASTNEDTLVNINVLANDTDADGETLTVQTATATNGAVTIESNGTLNYTPTANFNGTDTISYTITDPAQITASAAVTVTVIAVNDAPVAVVDTATVAEDNSTTINVLSNDTDADNDTLSVTAVSATNGQVSINSDKTLSYVPNTDFNGTDTINYSISDGNDGTASSTVTVTVTPVNDTPVAVADTASGAEDSTINVTVLSNDSDVDGDTLTVKSATADNGSVVISSNTLNFTPTADFNGSATLNYTIEDTSGATASSTVTVTVTSVNDNPVVVNDSISTNEDTAVTISALTNDSDVDGDTLTISSASGTNGIASVNSGQTITFTPTTDFNGTGTITYAISDGNGGTASGTITVTINAVNDLPVAVADSTTTLEDTLANINVLSNDSDVENDTLSITSANAANGVVTVETDKTLNYTPNANYNGTDTINYVISDGNGGTANSTVAVTITAVNDNPVAANDTISTNEDTLVNVTVLSNDTDVESDTLTVVSAAATNGSAAIVNDTTINYTPNANFNGSDTITYGISDGNGGSASATVAVTVTAVNDTPIANADTATTNEDTLVNINVIANDTDPESNGLSVTAASASNGQVVVQSSDQSLNYTPTSNFNGSDTINYTISDGNGGTANGTVTVTVTAVNDNPIAVNDTATTNEDTLVNITVLTNDSDPESDLLNITAASASSGVTSIRSATSIDYTPNANFNGSDTINYTISDNNGGTATATVAVTITPVNDAPVANVDTATTNEDTLVNINVKANDTDAEVDTLTVTVATASNGQVVIESSDSSLNYTPTANFFGSDTINYTISDGNGGSSSSTVTVTVTAVNDDPTTVTDITTTNEDTLKNIDVLANDSDVDGDTLTITNASATNGSPSVKADNTIDYVPNVNYNGNDTITYQISDGNGATASGTVSVTVSAVNDTPTYADATGSIAENSSNGTSIITMTGADVDTGDSLTYSIQTNSSSIFAINSSSGAITVADNSSLNYESAIRHDLVVKVTDSGGATATANATINVTNVEENSTPTLDTGFGNSGTASANSFASDNYDLAHGIAIDSSGKTVVVGQVNYSGGDFYIARFNTDGSLDSTFGNSGVVNKDLGNAEYALRVAFDSSSRIIVAGTQTNSSIQEVFVARYTTAGVLDTTFNSNGYRITSYGAVNSLTDMTLTSDDSILLTASGPGDFRLIKVAADGSSHEKLDIDFLGSSDFAYSVVMQSDGKAMISGTATNFVPALDRPNNTANAISTHTDFAAARVSVSTSPTLDTSYGSSGKVMVDIGSTTNDTLLTSYINGSDELYLGGGSTNGNSQNDTTVIKLDSSGNLITGFASSGKLVIDINNDATKNDDARSIVADSSGNLFVAIESTVSNRDTVIYKIDAAGAADSGYGSSGLVTYDYSNSNNFARQIAIDSSNRVHLATAGTDTVEESSLVARFTTAGVLDTGFSSDGQYLLDATISTDVITNLIELTASANAGKFVAVGTASNNKLIVTRFTSTGALDATFGDNGFYRKVGVESSYAGIAVTEMSDGSIIVTGANDSYGYVTKLTADGTLDTSFATSGELKISGSGPSGLAINAVTIDKNSKIVIGGTNHAISSSDLYLARLNTDGSFDTDSDADSSLSFTSNGYVTVDLGLDETIEDIATLSDGSIIGVGKKGTFGFVVKYLENGSLDTLGFAASDGYKSVDLDPVASTDVGTFTRVKVKSDGKIVAAGFTIDSNPINVIVQLNSDGSLDTTFDTDGIVSHNYGLSSAQIFGLDLDSQERIIITGHNSNGTDLDIFIARVTATGSKDTLFNSSGGILFNYNADEAAHIVKVMSDGSILIAGADDLNLFSTTQFFMQKYKLVEP